MGPDGVTQVMRSPPRSVWCQVQPPWYHRRDLTGEEEDWADKG